MKKIGLSRIFLACCLGFGIGIFIASYLGYDLWVVVAMGVLFVILTWFFHRERIVYVLALSALFLVAGLGYYHFYQKSFLHIGLDKFWDEKIEFEGQIIAEPDERTDQVKYTIKVLKLGKPDKVNKPFSDLVLITAPLYPQYSFADFIHLSGELEEPKVYPDFNYKAYLSRFGVKSVMYQPKISLSEDKNLRQDQSSIYRFWIFVKTSLFSLKERFITTLGKIFPEPYAAFLAGLLVGAKRSIPQNLLDVFSRTGTTHIVVISGFNLTIIAGAAYFLLKPLPKYLSYLTAAILIILFTVLTGAAPPVLRASFMALVLLWATVAGRRSDATIALILAATLMILINPLILRFDLGFQLSILATLGLIYFIPPFEQWFTRIKKKTPKVIFEALCATLAAQILVVPLILYTFGQLSLVAPLANILVLPLIPTVMLVGFVIGILGMIFLPLGQILGWFLYPALFYIIWILEKLAKIPVAALSVSKFSWLWLILYYIIITVIWLWWSKKVRKVSKGN